VTWIVRLVSIGAEGEERSTEVVPRIAKPDALSNWATLGLTLAEGKRLLACLQQEIVAAQAWIHAVRRPERRGCGEVCRVKKLWDGRRGSDSIVVGVPREDLLHQPEPIAPTSQLDWLSSTAAIRVVSCSRATRDRLKSSI
jgi:hypothetical protein